MSRSCCIKNRTKHRHVHARVGSETSKTCQEVLSKRLVSSLVYLKQQKKGIHLPGKDWNIHLLFIIISKTDFFLLWSHMIKLPIHWNGLNTLLFILYAYNFLKNMEEYTDEGYSERARGRLCTGVIKRDQPCRTIWHLSSTRRKLWAMLTTGPL